jgi:hypothetical protein
MGKKHGDRRKMQNSIDQGKQKKGKAFRPYPIRGNHRYTAKESDNRKKHESIGLPENIHIRPDDMQEQKNSDY